MITFTKTRAWLAVLGITIVIATAAAVNLTVADDPETFGEAVDNTGLSIVETQPSPSPVAGSIARETSFTPDLFYSGAKSRSADTGSSGISTVEEVLEDGLNLAGASPTHVVIRGVPVIESVRCDWRGIARTVSQREKALRFWLGLAASNPLPSAGDYAGAKPIILRATPLGSRVVRLDGHRPLWPSVFSSEQ